MKELDKLIQAYIDTGYEILIVYIFQYICESKQEKFHITSLYGDEKQVNGHYYFSWLLNNVVRNFSAHNPDAFVWNLNFQRGFEAICLRDERQYVTLVPTRMMYSFYRYALETDCDLALFCKFCWMFLKRHYVKEKVDRELCILLLAWRQECSNKGAADIRNFLKDFKTYLQQNNVAILYNLAYLCTLPDATDNDRQAFVIIYILAMDMLRKWEREDDSNENSGVQG